MIVHPQKKVRIVGAGLDLGSGRRGVDMGPSALRVAGLQSRLAALGYDVEDIGDVRVAIPETEVVGDTHLRFAAAILKTVSALADAVRESLNAGRLPIVVGGDHSIAIGSIAGAASYYQFHKQSLGVVWLDAHGDMNTADTTPTGNIHGMSLAIALGMGDPRFTQLAGHAPMVNPHHVALVGVRDLDPGEREHIRKAGLHVFTIRDVDELGFREVMNRAIAIASRDTVGIHVQLDMDVIDPDDAPGTGTPVRGGLSYREAHLAMEMLADSKAVRAVDIVEINPVLDERNRTAELALELLCSCLGKRIL